MDASVDDTLPEWKRLATEFGRLHGQAPLIRLHAEHCGEFRDERKAELSQSMPAIRLIEGKDGWLWWLDSGDKWAIEFLKLADAAGTLLSLTKSAIRLVEGKFTSVERGLKESSPTAEWFRELFNAVRIAGDTEPTRPGDCMCDAAEVSRRGCVERADLRRALLMRAANESGAEKWLRRQPKSHLVSFDDSLGHRYPKPTPDITAARPSVPFATIADELWQSWESLLYGAKARLSKLNTDTKRDDWLKDTYCPELAGCLKRVRRLLPFDIDLTDCSFEHRKTLRDLAILLSQLSRRDGILEEADEARFGEMVATFDRIRSQIESSAPIGATEAKREPPNPVERQPQTLVGGDGSNGKQPIEAEFVFRPDGDGYFLKWPGEQGHVPAGRAKGLHDFFRIIQFAGVPVPMLELEAGLGTERAKGDGRSRQFVADGETNTQLAAKRKELKVDIEAAESDMERNELLAELDKLEAGAKAMKGLKGKPRDLNNPNDLLRPKFLDRKTTAVARIRECGLPNLADHFDLAVTTKQGGLLYSPGVSNLCWDTSPKK